MYYNTMGVQETNPVHFAVSMVKPSQEASQQPGQRWGRGSKQKELLANELDALPLFLVISCVHAQCLGKLGIGSIRFPMRSS